MSHFFARLIPPRATFPTDMTAEERSLMEQHVTYTQQHFDAGRVLVFGPVFASSGAFGIAILDLADMEAAKQLLDGDPTVIAGLNRYELWPMKLGAAQAPR